MSEVKQLGNLYNKNFTGGNFGGIVYDTNGICPTLLTPTGGGKQPHVIEEVEDEKTD